jgi:hypothetical protein
MKVARATPFRAHAVDFMGFGLESYGACVACGARQVYGLQELLFMGLVDVVDDSEPTDI